MGKHKPLLRLGQLNEFPCSKVNKFYPTIKTLDKPGRFAAVGTSWVLSDTP